MHKDLLAGNKINYGSLNESFSVTGITEIESIDKTQYNFVYVIKSWLDCWHQHKINQQFFLCQQLGKAKTKSAVAFFLLRNWPWQPLLDIECVTSKAVNVLQLGCLT